MDTPTTKTLVEEASALDRLLGQLVKTLVCGADQPETQAANLHALAEEFYELSTDLSVGLDAYVIDLDAKNTEARNHKRRMLASTQEHE